jgi:multidrug transporter EmrE-like cation transporter
MTATALGLVLAAAVLHAAWNLLAKRAGGGAALVWLYGTASAVILMPPIIALFSLRRIDLGPTGLSYTLASAVLHVAYFLALQKGYEHGDLSVVYPVARGTGPVLSTVTTVAGIRIGPWAGPVASRDAGLPEELAVGPLGPESDKSPQLLAVMKGDHGRDRGNMQTAGKIPVGLHVQLHNFGTALIF